MGTLPQPDLKAGPHQDLVHDLHALHHRAGWPSLRVLAHEAGCSPTTVSTVFSSTRLPSWGVLELLVEAMDGDVHGFHELWLAATTPIESDGATVPIAGRRSELAVVRRQFDSASGGLLLVAGEAGMGKSRLVSVAAGEAAPATWVASGSCLPLSADVPLLPVADALRGLYDVEDGRWLRDALDACPPYVAGSVGRLLPELTLPLGAPPERDDDWSRYRLFT